MRVPRTGCSILGVAIIGQWAEAVIGIGVPAEVGFG